MLLTGFGAFGFPDHNLMLNYKVYVEDRVVEERKRVMIGLSDGKTPNKVDLLDAIEVRENATADIVIEYEKKDSIPYGKNGIQNHMISERINLCFKKSNFSNNGTDSKSGQIPFVCCIVKN